MQRAKYAFDRFKPRKLLWDKLQPWKLTAVRSSTCAKSTPSSLQSSNPAENKRAARRRALTRLQRRNSVALNWAPAKSVCSNEHVVNLHSLRLAPANERPSKAADATSSPSASSASS